MKKLFGILLGTSFLLLSLNVHLAIHYCHDEIMDISFSHNNKHCGGMEKTPCNGCEDVHVTIEGEQDQINQEFKIESPTLFFTRFFKSQIPQEFITFNQLEFNLYCSDSSPPREKLYILNSQFCFYG